MKSSEQSHDLAVPGTPSVKPPPSVRGTLVSEEQLQKCDGWVDCCVMLCCVLGVCVIARDAHMYYILRQQE